LRRDREVSPSDQRTWAESSRESQIANLLPYTNSNDQDKLLMLSIRLFRARESHPGIAMRDPLLWDQIERGVLGSTDHPLTEAFRYSGILSGEILGRLETLESQVSFPILASKMLITSRRVARTP
jgi:hypothetical protein